MSATVRPRASPVSSIRPDYNTKTAQKTFYTSNETEDITLFLPRNEIIANVEVTVPDDASVEPPTPYKYDPILFYGSSITEGGCCCRTTNVYNAIISNRLNVDYYNYGFSGTRDLVGQREGRGGDGRAYRVDTR